MYILVGLVVCAGGAIVGGALAVNAGVTGAVVVPPALPAAAALLLLIVAGEQLNVQVRVRSVRHGVSWADAVILIGLAIIPVTWMVPLVAAGITISKMIRRLQPSRIAFGAAKESITALVGGLVLALLGTPGSVSDPPAPLSLAVAFLVMTVVDDLLFFPVLAFSSRTSLLARYRENLDIRLLTLVGRFGAVVAAVLALELQPQLLYALPLLILVLHLWHERWVRTREERQAWQNLSGATERFTEIDLSIALRAAVIEGAKLFSADEIEVEVWLAAQHRLVRGDADTILFDGVPAQAPTDAANVYAVALHGYAGQRDIGALRLRFRNQIKISEREQAMLLTYAAALDTAVRNAAAYGKLGEATAAHAYAATHDPLTGLANRRELERQLAEVVTTATGKIALLLIDLKHFKEVNDALGQSAGDQLLTEVARRLRDAAGPDDLVCRFGGDEFAVLLRPITTEPEANRQADRLLAALAESMPVAGLPILIEMSAGLAVALDPPVGEPPPATSRPPVAELMRQADVAMHQARRTGKPLVCYSRLRDPEDRDRLSLSGELARAVARREFVLHFQPIVELGTGKVIAAEALARWQHPTRGELAPRTFLELLERSNHLPQFTAAVLDDALAAADMWQATGHRLTVAVNISARSLLDASLPRQVLDAIKAHQVEPSDLCLEITETLAIRQLEAVDRVLDQLYDLGVRLALDDFGTGFSSLAMLSRIPVHQLKIDRSFITTMHADIFPDRDTDPQSMAQARAVVRSTVQLGRALDLAVVAEGVETEVQRLSLWQLGCTAGQGHLFARAVPADRLLSSLARGTAGEPGTLARPLSPDSTVLRLSSGHTVGYRSIRRRS